MWALCPLDNNMEQTIKQKLGIVFLIIGAVLIIGFKWLGIYVIIVGVLLIVFGLFFAIRDDSKLSDSKWIGDGKDSDD